MYLPLGLDENNLWLFTANLPIIIIRMVGFLVAFSLMCYGTGDKIVIVLVSITWFVLIFLLLWCISMLHEGLSFSDLYQGLRRRLKDSIKELEWFVLVRKPKRTSNDSVNNNDDTELTSSRQLPSP